MKMHFLTLPFSALTFVAFGQVPTGTNQRTTNDTLLQKSVPKANKYSKKANKWPKPDSLKAKTVKPKAIKKYPKKKVDSATN